MTTSAFPDQKAARIFQAFDTDGDGFIEQGDFELAAARLGEEFGQKADSPAVQQLTQLHVQLWQQLAPLDTDQDGRVSLAEYQAASSATKALDDPATLIQGYRPVFEAITQIADADGDGKLTQDEYARLSTSHLGLAEDQAREAFSRLDKDGDGLITIDEMVEALHDYHLNDAPDSAGSWLLGPPEPV